MQLFTPKQNTQESQKKKDEYIVQISYLERTLEVLRKRLNTENENFENRLKSQRDLYSLEKINLQEEIKVLSLELAVLEKKRAEKMVPVNMLKKAEEMTLKKLEKQVREAENREYEAEKNFLFYQGKLDDISEKQSIIEENERKLTLRGQAIQAEADMVSNGHKDLNIKMESFYTDFQSKKNDLEKREQVMGIKEKTLQEIDQEHKRRFADDTKLLNDRRLALERFAKEIGFTK